MKRIISLTLALLMLVAMLCAATSCEFGMESKTGYTQFRDHIIQEVGFDKNLTLDEYVSARVATLDGDDSGSGSGSGSEIHVSIGAVSKDDIPMRITLIMDGSVEKATLVCEIMKVVKDENGVESLAVESRAVADILLTHYTGDDYITFKAMNNMSLFQEGSHREFATSLLNSLLRILDIYTTEKLDLDLHDLGFIVISDKYMAPTEDVEAEEDLGGAFSSARLKKAGLMLLQGVGMVFLVLAILWIVLLIFKAVFYKDPNKNAPKAEKPVKTASTEKPAPKVEAKPATKTAPTAPAAPATDDQLIAVITAAVAAAIESDPALSSQFASGFRVVSFKKTDKSRNR